MEIFENSKGETKVNRFAIIIVNHKEAQVLNDAVEEYSKNNKRKQIAKKMAKQFYSELPY